jgi:hypothetical protein
VKLFGKTCVVDGEGGAVAKVFGEAFMKRTIFESRTLTLKA